MNEMKAGSDSVAIIPVEDIRAACDSILLARMFDHAPRMRRLLRFLVEKAISGDARDTSEHVIGIEVFDRDAADYNTREDPTVRVQIGRLRAKLHAYYATLGVDADVEIAIPVGCYMPTIRRKNVASSVIKPIPLFAIHPFKCVSHHENGEEFTHGLHSELVHQLFRAFGNIVVVHSFFTHDDTHKTTRIEANHQVEGCVQVDAEHIRTSVRLVDVSTGRIAWSEQFNRSASHTIALQEELASTICAAVKRFLSHA